MNVNPYAQALRQALADLDAIAQELEKYKRDWLDQNAAIGRVSEALQQYAPRPLIPGDWSANVVHFLKNQVGL